MKKLAFLFCVICVLSLPTFAEDENREAESRPNAQRHQIRMETDNKVREICSPESPVIACTIYCAPGNPNPPISVPAYSAEDCLARCNEYCGGPDPCLVLNPPTSGGD